MTDERLALIDLVEKGADADLVRAMPAFAGGPKGLRAAFIAMLPETLFAQDTGAVARRHVNLEALTRVLHTDASRLPAVIA